LFFLFLDDGFIFLTDTSFDRGTQGFS